MDSIHHLLSRDSTDITTTANQSYGPDTGHLLFGLVTLLFIGVLCSAALLYLRRRRLARERAFLPAYHRPSHRRSPSVTNFPTSRNEAIFVYDEKMNLIANSSSPPSSSVPEIHITFPDEENNGGERKKGRVVVVHVTDTGSVGMGPLEHDTLPPYQRSDAERFQSLDLERIGGLREKDSTPPQRWS